MLKSVLYYLIVITSAVRLVDLVYLLSSGSHNLPLAVLIIAGAMIVYGAILGIKRFAGSVRLRQLMLYFGLHAILVATNLVIVSVTVPLQISMAETFIVGTFLDILLDVCAVYACMRYMRNATEPFVRVLGKERA